MARQPLVLLNLQIEVEELPLRNPSGSMTPLLMSSSFSLYMERLSMNQTRNA
jgi:hypothetical protein